MFSNNGQDAVIVHTEIVYPTLTDPGGWMGDAQHRYTWLAANLKYQYYNIIGNNANNINNVTKRGFEVTRHLFPFNRETCLLFESILDKSLENLFWGWKCWDADRAVVDALLESTITPGDQEEANKEEVKEKLEEAIGVSLNAEALELVMQEKLA
ncbi:uncharacterized protein FTJAE_2377 [Fusarium tjaetaba]|uniref:Uncharacterized protein n=1 Tax=Fusarium tjaetaba TaxID=1567544 RepID=A0A8H5W1W6_9HYPO|nr:uncharacterized protein FTJAE_2377 [Fusarium tjaetaba]KAF5645947.1 hypothetical protein FTJAE_2377 [Fusarium tjaetaba]